MTFDPVQYSAKLGTSAMQDRRLIASLLQAGVIGANDLLVSAGGGMTSSIAAGAAVVAGSFQSGQGSYFTRNGGPIIVNHGTADPTNPRIDQVFLKVYDSTDGGDSSDSLPQPIVVPGAPTVGAALPGNIVGLGTPPTNALSLSYVLVPAGAGSLVGGDYQSTRVTAMLASAGTLADYGYAFSTYKALDRRYGQVGSATAAGTYLLNAAHDTVNAVSGTLTDAAFYLDPSDWTANTRSTKLRLRAQLIANATATGITFTYGLYPITGWSINAAAPSTISTVGGVVTGSTVAFATPAASSQNQASSGDFTAPPAGWYAIGIVLSGANAANSFVTSRADLQMRQV